MNTDQSARRLPRPPVPDALGRFETPLLVLLALGALVRLATIVAFPQGFLSSEDAWTYVVMSWDAPGVLVLPDRPSGYPMLIEAFTAFGHHVWMVVAFQHLLGLAAGAISYVAMRRLGSGRVAASVVAAVLLLDSHLLTMEHWVLSDAAAGSAVVIAAALLVAWPRSARAVALAGLLLGVAISMRTAALFAVPPLLAYVLAVRPGWRVSVVALVAVAVLPVAYMTWHAERGHGFAMTEMSGWFLYARVGEIGRCGDADIPPEARPMCPFLEQPVEGGARTYLWGGLLSPAHRIFGGPTTSGLAADDTLGAYARAIIRDRPVTYARMVGRDVLRYADPGEDAGVTALEREPAPMPPTDFGVRDRLMPGFEPSRRAPAGPLGTYAQVVQVPRPLLALAPVALLVALAGVLWRRRLGLARAAPALALLSAGGLLVVGATATSEFIFRYALPALPLLAAGTVLVAEDLVRVWHDARRAPA